jgi:hypothetical protein
MNRPLSAHCGIGGDFYNKTGFPCNFIKEDEIMMAKRSIQIVLALAVVAASLGLPRLAAADGVCGPTYVVQPGDWLSKIANRCGVTLRALYDANPGVEWQRYIYPGQVLNIPGQTPPPPLPTPPPPYTSQGCATPWCQPFLPANAPGTAPYYWYPSMTVAPHVGGSYYWTTATIGKSVTLQGQLRNNGDVPLQVSAYLETPEGFYLEDNYNNCPGTLAVAATCTYSWVFVPQQSGSFYLRVYGKGFYTINGMTSHISNSSAFFFVVQ